MSQIKPLCNKIDSFLHCPRVNEMLILARIKRYQTLGGDRRQIGLVLDRMEQVVVGQSESYELRGQTMEPISWTDIMTV